MDDNMLAFSTTGEKRLRLLRMLLALIYMSGYNIYVASKASGADRGAGQGVYFPIAAYERRACATLCLC